MAPGDRRSGSPPEDRLERLLMAARTAIEEDRADEALRLADEAAAAAPRSAPALHCRAAALELLGRTEEARVAYGRAAEEGKHDPELLADAARFLVEGVPDDEVERVDLEQGLDLARRGSRLAERAGDDELAVELALVEARALSQLDRPEEALASLARAERFAPGDAEVLLEKGMALHELCRFEEARVALLAAEAVAADDPWIAHGLGLLAERRGDEDEARRRFARARRLAPEEFPRPIRLSPQAFEAAVEGALAALPEGVRRYLSNVAITVEDLPSDDDLLGSDPPLSPGILGLFRGAPWGQKASMDPWSHLPSSIVLYQRNLERFAESRAELVEQIGVTLVHEVGHFLGLDEEELYQRGLE
jgi:predicted Zn-dependent protease with MMP-like domain/Flp pilus assembly protein TadD